MYISVLDLPLDATSFANTLIHFLYMSKVDIHCGVLPGSSLSCWICKHCNLPFNEWRIRTIHFHAVSRELSLLLLLHFDVHKLTLIVSLTETGLFGCSGSRKYQLYNVEQCACFCFYR